MSVGTSVEKGIVVRFCVLLVVVRALLACGLLASIFLAPARRVAAAETIVFDFETADLQGWRVVEGEFALIVCDKKMYRNHPNLPYSKQGAYYLTTLEQPNGRGNAKLAGVVESPVFVLGGPKVSLMVGGGSHFNTYVALCTLDGKEVFKAHGRDTEVFRRVEWGAGNLVGKKVFLRVVDGHPAGWGYLAIDDVRAQGTNDPSATAEYRLKRKPILDALLASPRVGESPPKPRVIDVVALRGAIDDLIATFGDRYPNGQQYLDRLARLEDGSNTKDLVVLEREALTANPLIREQPILFVARRQYVNNHGTEATMCQTGEINTDCFRGGGAMKTLDVTDGTVTTILELPDGVGRDSEVHFDGEKILFSMRRNIEDDYHLYEINTDGTALTQLTSGSRLSDIQPVYMPDGKVIFSSTREPKYIPCQRHLMANLFTMNADGSNIRQIGHNTQFEGHSSLTPDGRILYTRWEYVDKHFASAYGLWTKNPDGTDPCLYYGGYAWQPSAVIDARIIPGTDQFVCIYTSVHNLPFGAMVVADRKRGLDGMEPILRSWPADISRYMAHWDKVDRIGGEIDSFKRLPVRYEDPYPLSEKYFLCSRAVGPMQGNLDPHTMGLFLVDVFGNELLLHVEAPGCFDPMPIAPRARPPAIPARIDMMAPEGTFYIQDVYAGQWMDRAPRGSAKYLRIVEAPPKKTFPPRGIGDWTPSLSVDSHHPVAVNWDHYNNKRILGTVPVERDGSAHFNVPAGRFVYFQLLDENGMMIHSMRSGTAVQPGERVGCIGCHESRLSAVPEQEQEERGPLALRRPPSRLEPWYGAPRNFSYTVEVQPVWDKHCVSCHDYGKEAAELNLSGDRGPAFNVSYTMLRSRSPSVWFSPRPGEQKPLISAVGAGPIQEIPPYSWGSHRSRLVEILRQGHYDVKLEKQDFDRIVTWIDLNTPYYPSHATYYRTHTFGRCPLDHGQLTRLGQLIPTGPRGSKYHWTSVDSYNPRELTHLVMTCGSPINFTRPEHSLCLKAFDDKGDPGYADALAIIRSGKEMLDKHPRLDMPGFRACQADQERLDYHALRQDIETRNRHAIGAGQSTDR